MLSFDKVYEYFNSELNALKDEMLSEGVFKFPEIPMEEIKIRYNGGDLTESDYTVSGREITITNTDVVTADCEVFKTGDILIDVTVAGNVITIDGGEVMTSFDLNMCKNVGDYLERLKAGDFDEEEEYINNGIIEHLGIEPIDTRVLTYIQTVGVSMSSLADYRDNALTLLTTFAQEQHDIITEITDGEETYDLHIRCTTMPDYSQNYKGHGQEEFNSFMVFDIKISKALDSSNKTETYINGTLIPYATVNVSKATSLTPDLSKNNSVKNIAERNTLVIEINGTMISDNAELQSLKADIETAETFARDYTIKRQKGTLLVNDVDYDIVNRTLELTDTSLDVSTLKVYNGTTLLTLTIDYTVADGVITITDETITMTDLILIVGDYCYINTYSMLLAEGDITNTYGEDITYRAVFQLKK